MAARLPVDLDRRLRWLGAKLNGDKAGVGRLCIDRLKYMKLPDDNSFDIVINEAILTMQTEKRVNVWMSTTGIAEARRVLPYATSRQQE